MGTSDELAELLKKVPNEITKQLLNDVVAIKSPSMEPGIDRRMPYLIASKLSRNFHLQ